MGRLSSKGVKPEMTPAFRLLLDPAEGTPEQEAAGAVVLALRDSQASDAKEFLAAFRRAVHLEPNDPDYHYILGDALSRLERHGEALPALREAVLMSPSDAAYHYALGVVLWNLGFYEEAAQALGEAERLRPDDPATLTALGAALVAAGRPSEAAGTLQRALRLDGERSVPYTNLGAALWGLGHASGREAEAKGGVDEALRLDPGCLRDRPATRERHNAMRIADMRDELNLEARRGDGLLSPAWRAAYAVLSPLGRGFRRLSPRLGGAGTFLSYLGLAAVVYSVWLFAPPYVDYFILKDRLAEIAGAPLEDDAEVWERLLHAVREGGLEAQVREGNCRIETRPRWRIIQCDYAAPIQLMPGIEHQLRFRLRVEKPYLTPGKTIFGAPARP
jgi:Flp pilus assembly protein TadD